VLSKQISDIIGRTIKEEVTSKRVSNPTLFRAIHESSLAPEDKPQHRLTDEAMTVVAAGVETTAFTLTVHISHCKHSTHLRAAS
jgi:hypothetical protein